MKVLKDLNLNTINGINGNIFNLNEGNSSIQGATGPKGDIGPQGVTGSKGDIGPQGVTGSKGDIGVTGSKGNIGPQGVTGSKGDIGVTGSKGDIGPQGVTGTCGSTLLNKTISYSGNTFTGFPCLNSLYSARFRHSVGVTLADSTPTPLPLDTTDYNPSNLVIDPLTGHVKIPITGKYLLIGSTFFSINDTQVPLYVTFEIRNLVNNLSSHSTYSGVTGNINEGILTVSYLGELSKDDEIYPSGYMVGGVVRTMGDVSGKFNIQMAIQYLGV